MTRFWQFLRLGFSLGLFASGVSAQVEIRSELEKRTVAVRAKLSDLYDQRDDPIPALAADLNPFFRVAGFVPPEPAEDEEPIIIPVTRRDADLLNEIAANLRINGIVSYNNRDLIVINQFPTPEGRMITTEFEGKTYFIRVEEIHSNRVVLSLGAAFTVLPIMVETRTNAPGATRPPAPN